MPTIQLEGVSLSYEEHGEGTPILLLHGLGSSGQDWEYVAPLLAAHHHVLIPDVRGHGRSDKPAGDYGVPLFAQDIAALCQRLGLTGLHVVGLSMGGMIAFQLAVDRPELVELRSYRASTVALTRPAWLLTHPDLRRDARISVVMKMLAQHLARPE